ncbi:MAG: M20/M25/M40 family metallo-hydrolase [Candidatus Bathyarchaeota archaeon]|nr:M20/M25/M40 family metallo-hydrolase [Candidatus Bathyarchaeota archaeon]
MLDEKLTKIEREVIGEIWQSGEMRENHFYMADEIGSRFAGTESEKRAIEHMVNKLKEYGYENAHADPFKYYGWTRGPASLTVTEPYQKEFPVISLAISPGGEVEAEMIDLGTGSPEEFEALDLSDVKGKIVLASSATSPAGKRVHRRTKYGYAVEYGAVGFIFMNHNPGQLPPTGSVRPAYRLGGEIPGVGISLEHGSHMRRLAKGRSLKAKLTNQSRLNPDTESANVVCELEGSSKKDEWIVIGGHFDGHDIAQGAMDNLSGTVVIMDLARALKKYEGKFKRSIRFICFACEEIGVTGSTSYVAKHVDEMKDVAIMLNLELGGLANKDGTQHAAFTLFQPPSLKDKFEEFANEIGYPMTVSTGTSAASDHWPFLMQGIPTVTMGSEPSPARLIVGRGWGHTTADMMDKVDPRNMQEGLMVIARLVLRLANQEEMIAERTPLEEIIANLEKRGIKKTLEIQKKWHPHSTR